MICQHDHKLGLALFQTYSKLRPGVKVGTVYPKGPGKLGRCLKCVKCGHSVTIGE